MHKKKGIWTITLGCMLALTGCTGQYNVLERVADTETEGEPIEINTDNDEATKPTEIIDGGTTETANEETTEAAENSDMYLGERPEYDPLKYVDVSRCDIKDIKLKSEDIVSDKDVDEYIHDLMIKEEKYADNTEAKPGDIVNIDYTAKEKGKILVSIKDEDRYVGNNTFPDDVDKKLEGVKAGDSIQIQYTYPKTYPDEMYKGKTVAFDIKINAVHGMEITDEVAKSVGRGNGDTAAEYKEFIKKFLLYNKLQDISDEAVDELCENAKIKSYPEEVMKYDVQKEFVKFYQENDIDGTDVDAFQETLKEKGYESETELANEIQDKVKKNLEQEMKVLALAKKYNLWLDDSSLSEEIMKQITGFESAEDYYNVYSKYHAQYCLARINLAKEIQKNGENKSTG